MSDSAAFEESQTKGYIHITERPSTLEEDEWALKWVRREFQSKRAGSFWGCSISTLILSCILAAILAGTAGYTYALGVLALAGCLLVYIAARYLWRGFSKPSLAAGSPQGTMVTLRFSVQCAWKMQTPRKDSEKRIQYWIMRLAPGIHLITIPGMRKRGHLLTGDDFVPGREVEIDLYIKRWPGLDSTPSGWLASIRSVGSVEIERLPFDKEYIPHPIYCFDRIPESVRRSDSQLDDYDEDEPLSSDWVYHSLPNRLQMMLLDLQHPIYEDLCEIIDDRPA